ncbi:MAG TPA: RNA polymerase subunit sigma, partial [Clostridia bacterium]|nr:RNA polymerase subunit sigma [Clostridia bacterium]
MDTQLVKDILFPRTLNQRVLRIQNKQEEMEPLIREYKPFILATARKCSSKSYITEQDDEYSVALLAFAEAIRGYRQDKGSFLSFAKRIIQMRCIDYYRKSKREEEGLASLDSAGDDGRENSLIDIQSMKHYAEAETARNRAL